MANSNLTNAYFAEPCARRLDAMIVETIDQMRIELSSLTGRYSTLQSLKQDRLVSEINIKTINGDSILGSGNLEVTASGIPTAVSELTNDSGYITTSALAPYRTATAQDAIDSGKADVDQIPTAVSELTNDSGYITNSALAPYRTASAQDAIDSGKADVDQIPTAVSELANDSGYITNSALAPYRTATAQDAIDSGKADVDQIPTAVSELTNDSGYITGAALAPYRTATAQDAIDAGKQSTLVSGSNIKTINGNSVLGSGNLVIEGGSARTNKPVFRAHRTATESAVQSAITAINWSTSSSTVDINTAGDYSTLFWVDVNTGAVVCPYNGIVRITASFEFTTGATTARRGCYIKVDGTEVSGTYPGYTQGAILNTTIAQVGIGTQIQSLYRCQTASQAIAGSQNTRIEIEYLQVIE